MKLVTQLLVGAATYVLTVSAASAAPVIVDFTFTGSSSNPGKVTGQLAFAASGTNVAATSIYVFTSTNAAIPANPTFNFVNNNVSENSFTVSSKGIVSAASFSSGIKLVVGQKLFLNGGGFQNDFQQGQTAAIYNNQGFVGITFKPGVAAVGAVPEPATWAMMMLGFGGMGYAMRRKTKVAGRIRFA